MIASIAGLATGIAGIAPGPPRAEASPGSPGATAGPPAPESALQPRPQNVVVAHRPASDVPILGPRYAPVTVDFFMSLGNSQSKQLHDRLMALQQRHPRRLRVIYRLVTTERYRLLAEAAMEAFAQDRFAAFLAEIVARARPPRTPPEIAKACTRAGMRLDRVQAAWADGRHAPLLERNGIERQRRASHVPGLLFNGVDAGRPSRLTADRLEELYREALALARTRLERGVPLPHLYQASLRELALATVPVRTEVGAVDGASGADGMPLETAAALSATLLDQGVSVPGHVRGPAQAPVVVRFYCNFLSPNCALLQRALDGLRKELPTQVRLIFHHMFPAPGSTGDGIDRERELLAMHRASLCAAEQDAFWDFYDITYRNFLSWRHRHVDTGERVRQIVDILGLDPERYQSCMDRAGSAGDVRARVRAARAAGVAHTPTVVIGGRIHPGVLSLPELRVLVEQELLPGLLEQLAPTWEVEDGAFERLSD